MRVFAIGIVAILFFAACGDNHNYAPKPRGFYRITFPKKEYREYNSNYPFTFMYPTYAVMELDKKPNENKHLLNMQDLLNMQFPQFNGTLHLSYETITSKKVFDELVEDAHKFAFKHTVKATSIDEGIIHYPDKKVYGIYYTIDGNAASSVQFYLTDSVHNYLRGALYFNSVPQLDSIQPVLKFVKQDVDVMIKSFKWKQ
ncbi:MAG TPA: gliding motility lipoprotein GldD [Mucilaginibacter sp.]